MSDKQQNRAHKARRSGVAAARKAERAKQKGANNIQGVSSEGTKVKNLKAFTFSSVVASQRKLQHATDIEHQRHHGHMERKDLIDNPPPIVVCVAGPPGSGKSTLIKCLTKHFTKMPSFENVGPVTVVANYSRRITFIEVPNDIGAMIDAAKIADICILTIDASFGFELETFEFLNILKTHGFPKVFGVLTHVDHFRTNAVLSRVKKQMKKRFWKEVCDGAKLFHMSGLIHGRYPRREILNLGRFLITTKYKPQVFRNEHPYCVVDRVEDMTHPGVIYNNPICDRTVVLYGYVRGTAIKPGHNVHLMGVGDFQVKDLEVVDDPLPLLSHFNPKHNNNAAETEAILEKRRSLKKQNIMLHAPFSNLGSVLYDKDAVYIKMRSHKVRTTDVNDLTMLGSATKNTAEDLESQRDDVERRLNRISEHEQFIKSLQEKYNIGDSQSGAGHLDEALATEHQISLFANDESITNKQFQELQSFRQGSTALPDDDDDQTFTEENGVVTGKHDVDEASDLLSANTSQHDDLYNRITIKEVVGADGRVRKQIVFAGDDDDVDDEPVQRRVANKSAQGNSKFNSNVDDDDDDDNFDDDNQIDDDDDGSDVDGDDDYYSDDEQLVGDEDEDDDEDLQDEDDFDITSDQEDRQYTADDFPDYASDEDEDLDDYDISDDQRSDDELVQLGQDNNRRALNNKAPAPAVYDISNFVKGGMAGVMASSPEESQDATKDGSLKLFSRAQFISRRQTTSLNELVYGAKESIFNNTDKTSFGTVDPDGSDQEDDSFFREAEAGSTPGGTSGGDADQNDDFFIMKYKSQSTRSGQGSRAGTATATQDTFAPSSSGHQQKAHSHIQQTSAFQSSNLFDHTTNNDSSFVLARESIMSDWLDQTQRDTLKNRFVTGDWLAAQQKYHTQGLSSDQILALNRDPNASDDSNEDTTVYPPELAHNNGDYDAKEFEYLRSEFRRKQLFNIPTDLNETWADSGFGKKSGGKAHQNRHDADLAKMLDHDEQLFGDFEELGPDGGDSKQRTEDIRARLEARIRDKAGFLDVLEQEARQDEADQEAGYDPHETWEKGDKGKRSMEKKVALNKEVMKNHFDFFQAERDHILAKVEQNKRELAQLSAEERLMLFGALPGSYVRIVLTNVPCEFIEHLNPVYPIVLGGLLPTEQNLGFLNMRVKKHRWYNRLLKSNDPLIFSSGWRRFQSIPMFYVEDATGRQRYLKYTPEHLHCLSTTYAPHIAVNTGIIAFKNVYMAAKSLQNEQEETKKVATFRVALTGVVLDVDKKVEIRKKLKLIGTPLQIFNKTAYIQGMFNSAVEVSRFEGAKIQTVSGIAGRVVKALTHEGRAGTFRAAFNDKIVRSDIIICKTFANVKLYRYYNPVTSLLLANKMGWKGMRTTKEMRADSGEVVADDSTGADHEYKDILRQKRVFSALKVPVAIKKSLPFKSKIKMSESQEIRRRANRKAEKMQHLVEANAKVGLTTKAHKKKLTYDQMRAQFVDKRDRSQDIFVSQVSELKVNTTKRQKEIAAEKKKRKIGNTTENRARIESLKKKAKKTKYAEADKKKAKKSKH